MSSVLTLSAGVSKEVATEFGKAAPKMAEIAKAAQKVNPALGDTAFLLDSLALGIKRGSKLILDNLGLNVSLGVAHEKFAKKVGKSTDELSSQEQVLAVLNEVLDINLSNPEREQSAGSFNVDLVAEDDSGDPVIIELELFRRIGILVTGIACKRVGFTAVVRLPGHLHGIILQVLLKRMAA